MTGRAAWGGEFERGECSVAFCQAECKCVGESHSNGTGGEDPGEQAGYKGGQARGMGVDKCGLIN